MKAEISTPQKTEDSPVLFSKEQNFFIVYTLEIQQRQQWKAVKEEHLHHKIILSFCR